MVKTRIRRVIKKGCEVVWKKTGKRMTFTCKNLKRVPSAQEIINSI